MRNLLNKFALFCFCLFVCQFSYAEKMFGFIFTGGGVDDMQLGIRTPDARKVYAYCSRTCEREWFYPVKNNGDLHELKKTMLNKKVIIEIVTERNNGRIAGPGEEEMLPFIKSIKFLN